MHEPARAWLEQQVEELRIADEQPILDLGGRDINGTIHALFTHPVTTVDIEAGRGVDIVADAADWEPDQPYEVVLCTEVFEHTPRWRDIIATASKALNPGGVLLVTCATEGRPPHGAATDLPVEGEFYENIREQDLRDALADWFDSGVETRDGMFTADDLYAWAIR